MPLSTRGIAMTWNWGDASPHAHTSGTGTFQKNLEKLVRIVSYLRETLSQNIVSRIILDDAAELSKLEGERFDVVVTDPPYADDVPYAELTDFYYVWLKRALSNVETASCGRVSCRRPFSTSSAWRYLRSGRGLRLGR
jgi:putative DNA methylase